MRIIAHEPVVVVQSTTEPICRGGCQDPDIHAVGKDLFMRYHAHIDSYEQVGARKGRPTYKSTDEGKTWKLLGDDEKIWAKTYAPLKNGDVYALFTNPSVKTKEYPPFDPRRERGENWLMGYSKGVYSKSEITPYIGEKAEYVFRAQRIRKGETEPVEEKVKVNWDGIGFVRIYNDLIGGPTIAGDFRQDEDGTIYLPVYGPYILPDGTLGSKRWSTHMLKSTDDGHTFDYVGTIRYREEYNDPDCIEIEGFNECAFEICDDGSFFVVMRSGSLSPFARGDKDHPAPKCFISRSYDKGKTWTRPEVFYDFGVLPRSIRIGGGFLLTSGRPGVFVRYCTDGNGKNWEEPLFLIKVPDEEVYSDYEQYTCTNNGICKTDERTVFIAYSDFKLKAPSGERAKSIIVRKLTLEP